jgi:hypothetical protein
MRTLSGLTAVQRFWQLVHFTMLTKCSSLSVFFLTLRMISILFASLDIFVIDHDRRHSTDAPSVKINNQTLRISCLCRMLFRQLFEILHGVDFASLFVAA